LSHLGDIILTEPVVRSVRLAHPDAEIHFLTREAYRDVIGLLDGVSSVRTLQIPGRDQSLPALTGTIRRICGQRYDLAIDLHNNVRSRWIRLWLNAVSVKSYPKNWRARRRAVKQKFHLESTHTVDLYLSALKRTGIPASDRYPRIEIAGEQDERLTRDYGLRPAEYCVFAVGASHPTKHYPMPQWVDLADIVNHELGIRVVIVEENRYDYLNLFDPLRDSGRLQVITGLQLPVLAELLSSASLTISNDSGIMHLSAAVGTPTVGLFGPTHPSLGFTPLGANCSAVSTNESCSPCSRHGSSPCYRDDRYCFTRMEPAIIMQHVRKVLEIERRQD
jgi:heptosyltransferase-2